MEYPRVIVAVIVLSGTSILLGQDIKTKQWTLPKAAVVSGQPLQSVAEMAVLKTANVGVKVTGSLFVTEEILPDKSHDIFVITLGKTIEESIGSLNITPTPVPNTDVFSEVRWVSTKNLGDYEGSVDDVTADALMKFGSYLQAKMLHNLGPA